MNDAGTITDTIAALTAELQARRKGTLQDRLAAGTDRPRLRDIDDPEFWRRFNAQSGIVEGSDDDGEAVKVATAPTRTPGVLTVEEGAHYLGVTPDQIKGFIADGTLRFINLGRGIKRPRIGLTIADLDDFIEHRRQRAVAPCPSLKSKGRRSTSTSSSGKVIGFTARLNARADAKPKR